MGGKPIFERDKVYKLRNGQEVRVICTDAPSDWPIRSISAFGSVDYRHRTDGRYLANGEDSPYDLMPPEPPSRYVNVYRMRTTNGFYPTLYETLSDAEAAANATLSERVARVRFKEGQFDD